METVRSADGTLLAFDRYGDGPPVILGAGAFNTRSATEPLGRALASQFTVLNVDRRGRGDSGDTAPYSVQREFEDLAALITVAGGSASLFGYSSAAILALKAAASGLPVTKIVLYEPPVKVGDGHPGLPAGFDQQLADLVAAGRRGAAVELYQTVAIGMPAELVAQFRDAPWRPGLEAIAHTLAYDAAIMGDLSVPKAELALVGQPTLVISGGESPPFLREGASAVAAGLARGQLAVLPGQTHDINPEVTAPVVAEFLLSGRGD